MLDSIVEGGLMVKDKNDDSMDNTDKTIDTPEMELRKKLFRAVMNSKVHLYFGYKHYYLLKFFRWFDCLCCCCFTKRCTRKFNKYKTNEKRM